MTRWSSSEAPRGLGISPRSTRVTRWPPRDSAQAIASPKAPAPITMTFIGASGPSALERELRGGEILERRPDRFEDRDLIVVAPTAARPAGELEEIAGDVVLGDDAGRERLGDV